jgi:hypothetical protein
VKIEIGKSLNGTFSGSIDESALESPEPHSTAGGALLRTFHSEVPAKKGQAKGINDAQCLERPERAASGFWIVKARQDAAEVSQGDGGGVRHG